MADIFSKKKRSNVMSKIRSKGNKSTELRMIDIFRSQGIIGWRRNYPINGRPDFVFLKKKIAVFVDGCFWHGHDCRNTTPKQNKKFWAEKQKRNMARDKKVTEDFENRSWIVIRVWECELKKKNLPRLIARLKAIYDGKL